MEVAGARVVASSKERILVGHEWFFEALPSLLPAKCSLVAVVTDLNVDELYGERLLDAAAASGVKVMKYVVSPGEPAKDRRCKEEVEDWLLEAKADRNTLVLALGGGVVGDLAGFIASTYLRGVKVMQVPTTLLAMVDSSIGGKTAVDTPYGKNLVGAFHHPHLICIDVAFLQTLPQRQLSNGMAEIIKVAAALDQEFFAFLEMAETARLVLEKEHATLLKCVEKAAACKAGVIDEDELDRGRRAILNLGHTVGHALEAILTPAWLHGECVAVGLVVEASASLWLKHLNSSAGVERIKRVVKMYGLRIDVPWAELGAQSSVMEQLVYFARSDKKSQSGDIRFVALADIGTSLCPPVALSEQDYRMLLSASVQVSPGSKESQLAAVPNGDIIRVNVPGSKSVSNRALLLAGLGSGDCVLSGVLHSDDTYVMLDALAAMGVKWEWLQGGQQLLMHGSAGKLSMVDSGSSIYLSNAGTASRFLTAACSLLPVGQTVVLTGAARMLERPIRPLVDALCQVGLKIEYLGRDGHFPLRIHGAGGLPSGVVRLDASISSQFASAILMAASPGAGDPVRLHLIGNLVSKTYVTMTAELMRAFGGQVEELSGEDANNGYLIKRAPYVNPAQFAVEADASSASYPLAVAALTGRTVEVNIGSKSLQGDAKFSEVLGKMGCRVYQDEAVTRVTGVPELKPLGEIDFEALTDTFMTIAAVAACAPGVTKVVGIANQRVKECDRIAATVAGLRSCGIEAKGLPDGIEITGREPQPLGDGQTAGHIECHKDHRIAMSFGVLGFRVPGVTLLDKACVDKTYPEFWHQMAHHFGMCVKAGSTPQAIVPVKRAAPQVEDPERRTIVLVGMRGSGKSMMGRALAHRLGRRFIDLDDCFENELKVEANAFIQQNGLSAFREREVEFLRTTLAQHQRDAVVSTGGGVVETPAARQFLTAASNVVIIQLHRAFPDVERLLTSDGAGGRASLGEEPRVTWERRAPLYEAVSHFEFFVGEGEKQWAALEEEFARFSRRVLATFRTAWRMPAVRVGPASRFISLTLPSVLQDENGVLAHVARDADALELRVDLLQDRSEDALRAQLAALRRHTNSAPIIFTLRSRGQGGKFEGDATEYFAAARLAVRLGCEFVDVESQWPRAALVQFGEWLATYRHSTTLIVSAHSMGENALPVTMRNLRQLAASCANAFGQRGRAWVDVLKVVGHARQVADCDVLQQFIRSLFEGHNRCLLHSDSVGIIAMLAGAPGKLTRLRNPMLTPCTHHALSAAAAPGQLTTRQLSEVRASLELDEVERRRLFLFGTPISASPSPAIMNAASAALLGEQYGGLPYGLCETDEVARVQQVLRSGDFGGANVTIPLKTQVVPLLHRISAAATAIGSVNTIVKDRRGTLYGDNTDWRAMFELSRPHLQDVTELRAVVVGAGGTARAACYAAQRLGAQLTIVNRTAQRGQQLAKTFGGAFIDQLQNVARAPHIVLCTVPAAAQVTLPDAWLAKESELRVVVELAYIPRRTAVVRQVHDSANEAVRVIEGCEILLEQAVWAYQIWTARSDAPRRVMARALWQHMKDGNNAGDAKDGIPETLRHFVE